MFTKKGGFPISTKIKPFFTYIAFLFSPTYDYKWYQWIFYVGPWELSEPFVRRLINLFGFHFGYCYINLGWEDSELTKARRKRLKRHGIEI